jgi:THO complex subunit 1
LHSCDNLAGMLSFRPTDVLMQLLTPVRFNVPNAESYAARVLTADLNVEKADTDDQKHESASQRSSDIWKGLRLASKNQLSSFDRIEHGKGLEALQPAASSTEATGDGPAPTVPDDRGADPQEEHHSAEEQRPDERSQVTADAAA